MDIKMDNIKLLRERTDAGMIDCKKALEEANGDIAKAVEILRKKGIMKAGKRSDREANEGIIVVDVNKAGNEGYILEINSETDFVARNEQFQNFTNRVLDIVKNNEPRDLNELMNLNMAGFM